MLEVEDLLQSEFATVMTIEFTKEIVKNALSFDDSEPVDAQINEEIHKQDQTSVNIEPQTAQMSVAQTIDEVKREEKPIKKDAPKPAPQKQPQQVAQPAQQVNVRPLKLRILMTNMKTAD